MSELRDIMIEDEDEEKQLERIPLLFVDVNLGGIES